MMSVSNQEVAYGLLIDTDLDDLEWPWTSDYSSLVPQVAKEAESDIMDLDCVLPQGSGRWSGSFIPRNYRILSAITESHFTDSQITLSSASPCLSVTFRPASEQCFVVSSQTSKL